MPGSNEHETDVLDATTSQIDLARALHTSVRESAGLDDAWPDISQNLREFYVRMAIHTDAKRAEFFRC
jgi:hypothetical protein